MLRDVWGSDYDHEAAMRYDPPAPPPRPFVVCRRCLRDDADTNQATCLCCGGELQRYGEEIDPVCDVCQKRPAVKDTGDGRPICRVCDENADEQYAVNRSEESQ